MLLVGGETQNVPLYYHMYDNFQIPFGREEFCLVTGLKFGVEYSDEYDDKDKPIPFRRRVFPSRLDGILQLVLLGLEDRRAVPNWILRDANVKRWLSLYAIEPTYEDDKKSYSICGFTWAFKNEYYTRHMRYPIIVAWTSNKKFYQPMLRDFLHVRSVPVERLIPDEVEAGSGWWLSSRAYFDGFVTEPERRPRHLNRQNHYEVPSELYRDFHEQRSGLDQMMKWGQNIYFEKMKTYMEELNVDTRANREPIIADQHYGISDLSGFQSIHTPTNNSMFNMGTPTNWKTSIPSQPGSSNWQSQMPAYTPTPNWQPSIPSHLGDAGLCDLQMNSWIEILIRSRAKDADWTVYMPINVGGNHWVTGVVNLPRSIFYVFDSMESQRTRLLLEAQIKAWTPVINGILQTRGYFDGSERPYHNFILSYNQVVPRESKSYWENIRYEMGELFYKCRCMVFCLWQKFDHSPMEPINKKSVGILVPSYTYQPESPKMILGFGICPVTLEPTILKINYPLYTDGPWYVSVSTLSSRTWYNLDYDCFPRQSIRIKRAGQAVIDGKIFWIGSKRFYNNDGISNKSYLMVSFDLVTHQFHVQDMPEQVRVMEFSPSYYISQLGDFVIISGSFDFGNFCFIYAWALEVEGGFFSSCSLLFTIPHPGGHYLKLLVFSKDNQPIVKAMIVQQWYRSLHVFHPTIQYFQNIGVEEDRGRQLAIMNLGHQYGDAIEAKDELLKAYEQCRDISVDKRAKIENFLKIESELDYEMRSALFRKAAKLEKQMRDKLGVVVPEE
nr:hypothetical protein [Tanacetum cinerariifolium]